MRNLKTYKAAFFACVIGVVSVSISTAEASRTGTKGNGASLDRQTGVCKTLPVTYNDLGQKTYGKMIAIGYDFTREECARESTRSFENFWTAGD